MCIFFNLNLFKRSLYQQYILDSTRENEFKAMYSQILFMQFECILERMISCLFLLKFSKITSLAQYLETMAETVVSNRSFETPTFITKSIRLLATSSDPLEFYEGAVLRLEEEVSIDQEDTPHEMRLIIDCTLH